VSSQRAPLRIYRRAICTLFQRPWRMIAASERPARAAAVANPARSECPAKSPSSPAVAARAATISASARSDNVGPRCPCRSIRRKTRPSPTVATSSQRRSAPTGQVASSPPNGGEDTKRNFQHVKDRGEAGPIGGILNRYSIEQTPSDKDLCSKTGSTLRPPVTCDPLAAGVGAHHQFRVAITTGKRRRRSVQLSFGRPGARATRSSCRLAC
jgi:hypothetical protein